MYMPCQRPPLWKDHPPRVPKDGLSKGVLLYILVIATGEGLHLHTHMTQCALHVHKLRGNMFYVLCISSVKGHQNFRNALSLRPWMAICYASMLSPLCFQMCISYAQIQISMEWNHCSPTLLGAPNVQMSKCTEVALASPEYDQSRGMLDYWGVGLQRCH